MRNSITISVVVITLLLAALVGDVVSTRRRAKAFIEDLRALDASADPTSLFISLKQRYGRQLRLLGCDSDDCVYNLSVSNGILARLHLAPQAEIRTQFTLRKGSLFTIYIEYTSAVFRADSPIVNVQEAFCPTGTELPCDEFYLNPHGRDQTPVWNGDVEFSQRATQEEKQAALAFNLHCFLAFHGCKDISELLPAIWKRTSPGAVSSRMRSMADSIEDASQPPPE